MTMSLIARNQTTGAFGIVVCSSSPAVAARCAHVRPGVGVCASQNITNPELGTIVLDAVADGLNARAALAAAIADERHPGHRQVTVVGTAGDTAAFSGEYSLGTHAHVEGDNAVAAGNLLADEAVIDAMHRSYQVSRGEEFEERLLDGLRGALAAGGEAGPVHSAGLVVVDDVAWPVTDLRVDFSHDPLASLEELWRIWLPQRNDYRVRGIDPTRAPSYGVPGDE